MNLYLTVTKALRATVLKRKGCIEVQEVEEGNLDPKTCRVSVKAVGVCSTDVDRAFNDAAYRYPLIMGHEISGEVLEVGSKVVGVSVGDRVTVFPLLPCFSCESCQRLEYRLCHKYDYYGSRRDGGYAERMDVRAWNLLRIPRSVSFDDAALCEPTSVVIHALDRLGVLSPNSVRGELLILGGGFLGLIAAQLVSIIQPTLKISVVDRNQFKLDLARALGCETEKLSDETEWDNYTSHNSGRFSLLLEASGMPELYRRSVLLAARGATVVWMGNIRGNLSMTAQEIDQWLRREISVHGTWNSTFHGNKSSDWTAALDYMSNGLKPKNLVTMSVGLDEIGPTLESMHNHKLGGHRNSITKIIVNP